MRLIAILVAALALALPACGVSAGPRSPAVAIRDAVIRPAPTGLPMTAAYMSVFNATAHPLVLKSITCDCAGSVTAHMSRTVGGVMQMRPAGPLSIPPHGALRFEPGGMHLMVEGLKRPIKVGDSVPMRLGFAGMAPITVRFTAAR